MIFFDIDDTLFDNSGAEITAAGRYFNEFPELHVYGDQDEFIHRWRQTTETYLQMYIEQKMSFQEQRRRRLRDIFRRPLDDHEADTLFNIYLRQYEESWRLFADAVPCLERLAPLRLGIITNGNTQQQHQKLQYLGIMDRFEVVVVSDEIGFSKPEKEIFLHACKRAGKPPEQCVYIGDKLEVDALAGRKAGLNSIWLNRGRVGKNSRDVPEINSLNELSKEVLKVANNPENRRQSTRSYPTKPFRIAILEKQFKIENISNEGMGIAVEGPDAFFIGQRIDSIVFEGEDPKNSLSGIVSHISKDQRGFLCGIRFVFDDSRDYNYVKGLTLRLHEQHGNA